MTTSNVTVHRHFLAFAKQQKRMTIMSSSSSLQQKEIENNDTIIFLFLIIPQHYNYKQLHCSLSFLHACKVTKEDNDSTMSLSSSL
jgi:hypothetical protein